MNVNITNWFFLNNMESIDIIVITVCKYVIHRARLHKSVPSLNFMLNVLKVEAQKEYNLYKLKSQRGTLARLSATGPPLRRSITDRRTTQW